eukprot:XP_001693998.1 predicted protein [Chlamydomonas reinhardtii]
MPSSAASALMEKLRVELEDLIEQLSKLAEAKRMYGSVKLRPLNPTAWNCLAHSYWERGDLFMAGCCLASGLRHCPSVAAHQMMSLLAERCGCADLPDLHYNRAALHAFTQDFAAALQSESLLVLLGQLAGLVAGRGGVKERHWAAVTSLLAADAARGAELLPRMHHERLALRTLTDLVPGSNRGVVLLCRPLVFVAPPLAASSSGTLYLVCVDTAGAVLALALTHIPHDAFDMTALLAVLHPELRHVHVTSVLVDGVPLHQAPATPLLRHMTRAA